MGQSKVYNYLKKVKRACTSREIAKALNTSSAPIGNSLKKMYKYREIQRVEILRNHHWIYTYWIE